MNDTLIIDAVRKAVTVNCSVEEAFKIYTAEVDTWWPTDSHSIHGERVAEIVFEEREGGEVYEVTGSGEKAHWATVRAWEPPRRLVLAWEVDPGVFGTEVEVVFTAEGKSTLVEVEHRGWERLAERAAEKRAEYDTGWDFVLGKYVDRVA
jgi:uncharacterized protein YndB with AHSA1/START domain